METDDLLTRILNGQDDLAKQIRDFQKTNFDWQQHHDNKDGSEFSSVRDLIGRGLGELRDRIVRLEPLADHVDVLGEFSKDMEIRVGKLEQKGTFNDHLYEELNSTLKALANGLMPRVQKLEEYHRTNKTTDDALEKQRSKFEKRMMWLVGLLLTLVTSELFLRLVSGSAPKTH